MPNAMLMTQDAQKTATSFDTTATDFHLHVYGCSGDKKVEIKETTFRCKTIKHTVNMTLNHHY